MLREVGTAPASLQGLHPGVRHPDLKRAAFRRIGDTSAPLERLQGSPRRRPEDDGAGCNRKNIFLEDKSS